jgi:ferredoxin
MTTFRVVVDRSLCSGFGSCEELAPTIFEVDPSGIAAARTSHTDDSAVLDAASSCPMAAISVFDAETGDQLA